MGRLTPRLHLLPRSERRTLRLQILSQQKALAGPSAPTTPNAPWQCRSQAPTLNPPSANPLGVSQEVSTASAPAPTFGRGCCHSHQPLSQAGLCCLGSVLLPCAFSFGKAKAGAGWRESTWLLNGAGVPTVSAHEYLVEIKHR